MKSHFCRDSLYQIRDYLLIPFARTNEIRFFKFFKLCQNLCHLKSKNQKTQCFQRVSVLRQRTANPRFPSSNLGGASNLNVMENAPIVIIWSLLGRFRFRSAKACTPKTAENRRNSLCQSAILAQNCAKAVPLSFAETNKETGDQFSPASFSLSVFFFFGFISGCRSRKRRCLSLACSRFFLAVYSAGVSITHSSQCWRSPT